MIPKVKIYRRRLWQNGKPLVGECYVAAPTRYLANLNHNYRCIFDHCSVADKVTYTATRMTEEQAKAKGYYVTR